MTGGCLPTTLNNWARRILQHGEISGGPRAGDDSGTWGQPAGPGRHGPRPWRRRLGNPFISQQLGAARVDRARAVAILKHEVARIGDSSVVSWEAASVGVRCGSCYVGSKPGRGAGVGVGTIRLAAPMPLTGGLC